MLLFQLHLKTHSIYNNVLDAFNMFLWRFSDDEGHILKKAELLGIYLFKSL